MIADVVQETLIDIQTGKVVEFHNDEIEELQRRIAEKAGYRLVELRPVGQFRWSTHVELASLFLRA